MSNVAKFRRRKKARHSPVLLASLAIIGIAAGLVSLSLPDRAKARDDVSRTFTFYHTGGGTNCVVDGDMIWLDGQKIRVDDIDAPETHPLRCATEEALGERATQRLHQLANAGPFTVSVLNRDTDRDGRKLRVLTRGGQSLGDVLVSEGLARTWSGGREPWC